MTCSDARISTQGGARSVVGSFDPIAAFMNPGVAASSARASVDRVGLVSGSADVAGVPVFVAMVLAEFNQSTKRVCQAKETFMHAKQRVEDLKLQLSMASDLASDAEADYWKAQEDFGIVNQNLQSVLRP